MEPAAADLPSPLLAHLDRLMDGLHLHVPLALNDWDPGAIHQARVATRRLTAALDLLKPVLGKKRRKPLAKVLRRLRRRLGPLRDADVLLGHLAELATSSPRHAAAAEWLSAHVRAERDQSRIASARRGTPAEVLADLGVWHPVRERIAESADALPALLARSLHAQLDAFIEQAGRVSHRVDDTHDPHQLRIAGKALRYGLEMALAQGYDVPSGVLKKFKRMQDLLGTWHDYVVLTDKTLRTSLDSSLAHHDPALQEKVFDLARVTLRRSAQQLKQFLKLWSSEGEALSGTIRSALPVIVPAQPSAVSESQMGPGPTDSPDSSAPEASLPGAPSAAS
jgi:CHAD domain-containing protein